MPGDQTAGYGLGARGGPFLEQKLAHSPRIAPIALPGKAEGSPRCRRVRHAVSRGERHLGTRVEQPV